MPGGVAGEGEAGDGSIGFLRLRHRDDEATEDGGGQQQGRQDEQAPISDATEIGPAPGGWMQRIDRRG